MWHPTPPSPPHTCVVCGNGGVQRGPYWQLGQLRSPIGLAFEKAVTIYACRPCFVSAMCHPDGPLPELDPQSFDEDMSTLRELRTLTPVLIADIERLQADKDHLSRVVAEYEEVEEHRGLAELDVDALATAVAAKLAPAAPPAEEPKVDAGAATGGRQRRRSPEKATA